MVKNAVHAGEHKVNNFLNVISLHFNIFLFPLFLVWLGIGIFIGIKYCGMTDNLEEVRLSMRQRLESIGFIGSSLHGSGHDLEPSPDRKSIELHRRQSNKAFFGIESPARPNVEDGPDRPLAHTQYHAIELSESRSIDNLATASGGTSVFGDEDQPSEITGLTRPPGSARQGWP